jgi:hypothetical protein
MIYKKPGCVELDKLRVIHLFEADFNLMIGILFGRRAMYHQADQNLLNPAQFGRPSGECEDSAISKLLHNLVSSLTHTPMGKFESDATACFDREVMTALMKIGFNRNTAHRVVYGPSRYGGLGFRDLFVEQGVAQVQLLVRHLRAGTTQGILMRITLSWWQMVVGVSYPLLGQTYRHIPFDDPPGIPPVSRSIDSH